MLAFWANRDVDLWVNQRLLVTSVRGIIRKADKDTIRSVLADACRERILIERQLSPRRVLYRLSPRFSDPCAPGYAREVDETLLDPMTWVTEDGRFFRIGRKVDGRIAQFPLATFPHHFAKHAWMRAWIHLLQGTDSDEGSRAQKATVLAARAPFFLLRELGREDARPDGAGAAWAVSRSRLWRSMRGFMSGGAATLPRSNPADAFRLLHDLCGHHHLRPLLGPALAPTPEPPLDPRRVFLGLDASIRDQLGGLDAGAAAVATEPLALACTDPLLAAVGAKLHDSKEARSSCLDRRWGWMGGGGALIGSASEALGS